MSELLGGERNQRRIVRGPQAIALEAEVLETEACLRLVRHHRWTPVLEVLNATDADTWVVDVDPVVRKDVRSVDHEGDTDEVAIGKTVRRLLHRYRGRRVEPGDQLPYRDAGDEVATGMLLSLARRRSSDDRAHPSALVLDPVDRLPEDHRLALLPADCGDTLPHLPRSESRVPGAVDQGGDDLAAVARLPAG